MGLDSIGISAIVWELRHRIVGGKIQKVRHPFLNAISLEVYAHRDRQNLLISIQPTSARLHLTSGPIPASSDEVTPLLLLLRKHLVGAHIDSIRQLDLERVVFLSISRARPSSKFTLAVEIMGRHSNVLLLDEQDIILDAFKRVPPSVSRQRPVLPRLPYVPPPPTGKHDWRALALADLVRLAKTADSAKPVWAWLLETFAGLGAHTCREIAYRAYSDLNAPTAFVASSPESLLSSFKWLAGLEHSGRWEPTLVKAIDGYTAVFPFRPTYPVGGTIASISSMSQAVELLYAGGSHGDRLANLRARVLKEISTRHQRALHTAEALQDALNRAARADELVWQGQMLLAYQGCIAPGATSVTIEGTQIDLDPQLDVVRNAQRKFHEAKRLSRAVDTVRQRLEQALAEGAFWEQQLAMAELAESAEVLQRLLQENSVEEPKGKQAPKRQPLTITLVDGSKAIIGRTSLENQRVLSLATAGDLWLHAKDYPGSHIVIKGKQPPPSEGAILEAASYAAYFSRARTQPKVGVMVAKAQHVRKKPGGPPGSVLVTSYRTVVVEPKSPLTGKPGEEQPQFIKKVDR